MARFRGSNWKKSRRLGISLSGTGKELENVLTHQDNTVQTNVKIIRIWFTITWKQKLRYLYGMTERQFRNTFDIAGKQHGVHGENFMILLASRLDAVVYSLGLARTRRQARQLVGHGHVEVDGRRVDIPSYSLKPGQVITVREKSQNLDIIKESVEINNFVPEYLDFDADSLKGTFVRFPERSELPAEINEQLIVEYYSR